MPIVEALNPLAARKAAPANTVWHSQAESASDLAKASTDVNDFGSTLTH
jgi:hypothetical protein